MSKWSVWDASSDAELSQEYDILSYNNSLEKLAQLKFAGIVSACALSAYRAFTSLN